MVQTAPMYGYHLVTTIERELGRPLVSSVREAFLHVPRHLFIPFYYEGNHLKTPPVSRDREDWRRWLAQIYADEALVTQIDDRGLPTSSSSQPSVMACMFEHLDAQPGQRILEIGTGTGYNAALAAALANNPHLVTTIDIDPTLINLARPRIEQAVGAGMTVHACNGLGGYVPNAPYDRIIATGSFLPVPWTWIEQLKPSGRLVMDLRGQMGGGLMVIIKQTDGQAVGQFLTEMRHISFMHLRSAPEELATFSVPRRYQQFPLQESVLLTQYDPAYDYASHFYTYEQFRGQDDEVNTWLQWVFPGLDIKWKGSSTEVIYAMLTDYPTRTVATIKQQENGMEITVRGERLLWSEILQAYQDWLKAGKPGRESYTLLIDQQGRQVMGMKLQDISRTFPLTEGQNAVRSYD